MNKRKASENIDWKDRTKNLSIYHSHYVCYHFHQQAHLHTQYHMLAYNWTITLQLLTKVIIVIILTLL